MVEQRTENPRVDGSIPPCGTTKNSLRMQAVLFWHHLPRITCRRPQSLISMRALIIGWLLIGLLLAAASYLAAPYLQNYNEDDIAFAHEYAGDMLRLLEQTSSEADKLAGSPAEDRYLAAADEFDRRKQAAVHFKGDLAYDFVYAFACAEEWCRASAAARYRPHDAAARERARVAHDRAKAEFTSIGRKEYKKR